MSKSKYCNKISLQAMSFLPISSYMGIFQKSKIGNITTLMVFSLISVGGCTTTYLDMQSWEGRTINDLYFEWGKADEVEGSYNRIHTWYFDRTVDGEVKTCKKSFYTKYDGNAEVIVDTKYSDCLFLIAK